MHLSYLKEVILWLAKYLIIFLVSGSVYHLIQPIISRRRRSILEILFPAPRSQILWEFMRNAIISGQEMGFPRLKDSDLKDCLEGRELSIGIINEYAALLCSRHLGFSLVSPWYLLVPNLCGESEHCLSLSNQFRRCFKGKEEDFLRVYRLLFPILLDGFWLLCIISPRLKKLEFISCTPTTTKERIGQSIKGWVKNGFGMRSSDQLWEASIKSPPFTDASQRDSAVWMLMNMQCLLEGWNFHKYKPKDIQEKREVIVRELLGL